MDFSKIYDEVNVKCRISGHDKPYVFVIADWSVLRLPHCGRGEV